MSSASFCRRIAAAFLLLCLVGSAAAQSLTAGNGVSLTGGTSTTVTFHDASRGGQTVVITITSDGPTPQTQERFLLLDAHGNGSFEWRVPTTWDKAYFNAPGMTEVS